MKKILLLLLLFISPIVLTGCGLTNNSVPNEGTITLNMTDEYLSYLDYKASEVPNFTLSFDGVINTNEAVESNNQIIFSNNDDFTVSEIIANLINKYKDDKTRFTSIVVSEELKAETRMNSKKIVTGKEKYEKHYLEVYNKKIFNEICYITLENGLQLSIDYRRFQSIDENDNLITYYAWQYRQSIRMILHYPLMLIQKDNKKSFVIVPLLNNTTYTIGTQLDVAKVIKNENYLTDEGFRTFFYPDYDENKGMTPEELQEQKEYVKKYYIDNFNGSSEEIFTFEYLERIYSINFNEKSYVINYIG